MNATQQRAISNMLQWIVKAGIYAIVFFVPLIVTSSLFFPYITGKNFFFRIATEIIFIAWAILALIDTRFRPRRSPILATLGIFIAFIGLATVFGANPYHSFWSNFERMEGYVTHLHLFALFLAASHTLQKKREWAYVLAISLGASVITSLYAVCEHIVASSPDLFSVGGQRHFCDTASGGSRPFSSFGNPIYFAVYLMFHLFFIAAITRYNSGGARIALIALGLFEFYIFFLASSRGAFIGLIAGVGMVAFLTAFFTRARVYRLAALGSFASLALLIAIIFLFPQSALVANTELFSRLSRVSIDELTREPRVMIWGMALEAFSERPVLGWGPENFIIPYAKYYNPNLFGNEPWFDRAHNMFFEWLVAGGIIGLLAYLSIFAATGFVLWRLWERKTLSMFEVFLGIGILVAYLVQDAFVFDNITTFLFLFAFLAFVHSLSVPEVSNKNPSVVVHGSSIAVSLALVVLLIPILYLVNIKPMLASKQLLDVLQYPYQPKATEQGLIDEFRKVAAYNTFGTTEARERLSDLVNELIISNNQNILKSGILIDTSIEELEAESARQPEVIKYHLFLGRFYVSRRTSWDGSHFAEAEKHYQKAIELAPNYVQSYFGLAELYLMTNQRAKATDVAKKMFSMPDLPGPRTALLVPVLSIHLLAGSYQDAVTMLNDYSELYRDPLVRHTFSEDDAKVLIRRSFVQTSDVRGRLAFFESILAYQQATGVDLNPRATALLKLGAAQTYVNLGDRVTAKKFAEEAAELNPELLADVDKFLSEMGAR